MILHDKSFNIKTIGYALHRCLARFYYHLSEENEIKEDPDRDHPKHPFIGSSSTLLGSYLCSFGGSPYCNGLLSILNNYYLIMRKCVNCGGNNFDTEIYCDWCGEKILPEKKMTLLLFLKYYFNSFAILGVMGAIIFYITTFLNNYENEESLKKEFLGFSLRNVFQFGLLVCFCFFILLLFLLIIEITRIKKTDFSLKFLVLFLFFFLIFVVFLFLIIGLNWLDWIVVLVTTIIIFAVYYHLIDIFFLNETEKRKKSQNLLIICLSSIVLFFIILISSLLVVNLVNYIGQVSIPFEEKPAILKSISNGLYIGILFGTIVGTIFSGAFLMSDAIKGIMEIIREMVKKIKH